MLRRAEAPSRRQGLQRNRLDASGERVTPLSKIHQVETGEPQFGRSRARRTASGRKPEHRAQQHRRKRQ